MTASSKKRRGVASPQVNNYTREKNVNVASMIQKFKKDDKPIDKKNEYKVLNMPRNTLLEPNNVVAAWCGANSSEEVGEVSATLKALRKKYDTVHQTVQAKQQQLEALKRKLAKTCEEEIYVTNLNDHTETTMGNADKDLTDLKEEHDFEKLSQKQYEYVKQRM